jgi:precorrin-6y C5,15-methyltransferase (decarboxylating) CbiE subunit
MNKFVVVGMGPGGLDHILPAATRAAREADILVGSHRFLALFPGKEARAIGPNMESALDIVEIERASRRVALLVSGDPGLYSLLGAVRRRFPREDYEVVPGISSFQLAFAKAGIGWEGATIVSVHGRSLEALSVIASDRPGVVFLGGDNDAAAVASVLAGRLGPDRPCIAARDLDDLNEALIEGSLAEIASREIGGLCVLILP